VFVILQSGKRETIVVVKLYLKRLVILLNMEVSGLEENKTEGELRSSEKSELGFRYTILGAYMTSCLQSSVFRCCASFLIVNRAGLKSRRPGAIFTGGPL